MKKRKPLFIFILLVALGAPSIWFLTHREKQKGTLNEEEMKFAFEDTASVTQVIISDKTGKKVSLVRNDNSTSWTVNRKFTARPDAMKTLLGTIHSIAVKSPVGVKARETILKWMVTGAIKVEVFQGDDRVRLFYVGSETPDQLGTYMLLSDPETEENAESPFIMEIPGFNGYLTTRFFTSESEWRDRTVFRYSPPEIRSIRVEHFKPANAPGFEIELKDAYTFSLKSLAGQPLPFDTISMKQYITYYGAVGFEAIEDKIQAAKKDSVIRSGPAHLITLKDAKNKTTNVKLFLKQGDGEPADSTQKMVIDPDRMYALIDDKDFVLVQYYVFGKLLQTPEYFVPKAKKK